PGGPPLADAMRAPLVPAGPRGDGVGRITARTSPCGGDAVRTTRYWPWWRVPRMRPPVSRSCESDLTYDRRYLDGPVSEERPQRVAPAIQPSVDTKTFFTSL